MKIEQWLDWLSEKLFGINFVSCVLRLLCLLLVLTSPTLGQPTREERLTKIRELIEQSKQDFSKLSLELKLDKASYLPGEQVKLVFQVVNTSDASAVLERPSTKVGTLGIHIIDTMNVEKKYTGPSWGIMGSGSFSIAEPGKSVSYESVMLCNHRSDAYIDDRKFMREGLESGFPFLRVGTYYVVARYGSSYSNYIESEPVRVVIKQPIGADLIVWNTIKSNPLFACFLELGVPGDYEQVEESQRMVATFEDLLLRYPRSTYAPFIRKALETFRGEYKWIEERWASGYYPRPPAPTAPKIQAPTVVANDNFTAAIPLTGSTFSTLGTTVGATRELGEPQHGNTWGGKSVWWSWVAPISGTISLSTQGSSFDTTLGVYTGTSLYELTNIAANDDIDPKTNRNSELTFKATAGQLYRIAVDGYTGAAKEAPSGSISLSSKSSSGPINDDFADATVLPSSTTLSVTSTNVESTKELNEPKHAGRQPGRSVWWSWVAPESGTVSLDTIGSNFDTVLEAYTGASLTNLTSLASDDDMGGNSTSKLAFTATAGQTYFFVVDGYADKTGNITLNLRLKTPTVYPPVTITSFTPTSGEAGSLVVITGNPFLLALQVTFNGVSADFGIESDTKIIATVPSTATSGPIGVNAYATSALSSQNFSLPATISNFTPKSARPGTPVIISGTNFLDTSSVTFNGVIASFTVNNNEQITAIAPDSTLGPIALTTPAGVVIKKDFIFSPVITSFTPTVGPASTSVTITGQSFFGVKLTSI
ncbi:IPT/TIG domain-containing protein [Candidatus Cyanaurora vandensis]|uniref:PPC domain-containing protein n=1 Tax=Candidatus Cyanaurora vandensis TaxID=2714958 RepID=UPI00257C1442|nr:IPT/TIG domain-containing protein [Candidatus Cyanaurora vandensis]